MLYACDGPWWECHLAEVELDCQAKRFTFSSDAEKFNAARIYAESKPGLGKEKIHLGNNSGYQAVNLAYLFSAKFIGLLGFDMQATGGDSHWHGDHPKKCRTGQPNFDKWIKDFSVLAGDLKNEGVKVVNYTRTTALNCFERGQIERLAG